MEMRDRVLFFYLIAVAALFGAELAIEQAEPAIIYAISYLSVGAGFIVAQHSDSISQIVRYIRDELSEEVRDSEGNLLLWESSTALHDADQRNIWMRTGGELFIVTGPIVATLAYHSKSIDLPMLLTGIAASALLAAVFVTVHRTKMRNLDCGHN